MTLLSTNGPTPGVLVPASIGLAATLQAGDLIFVRRPRYHQLTGTRTHRAASWLLGAIIWLGQSVRRASRPWANFTHVACSVGGGSLIEAHAGGVKHARLSEYVNRDYYVVRTGLGVIDREQAIEFLRLNVGDGYGYLIFLGIALRMLTPTKWGPFLGWNHTNICSGLAAQMLERAWYVFDGQAAQMDPAELARDLGVPPHAA